MKTTMKPYIIKLGKSEAEVVTPLGFPYPDPTQPLEFKVTSQGGPATITIDGRTYPVMAGAATITIDGEIYPAKVVRDYSLDASWPMHAHPTHLRRCDDMTRFAVLRAFVPAWGQLNVISPVPRDQEPGGVMAVHIMQAAGVPEELMVGLQVKLQVFDTEAEARAVYQRNAAENAGMVAQQKPMGRNRRERRRSFLRTAKGLN
jgi:hypothetical protein